MLQNRAAWLGALQHVVVVTTSVRLSLEQIQLVRGYRH